jgi:hypothetical protein
MLFASINDATLLIALGLGYVVLYLAKKEQKRMQFYGYLIGIVIIALASVYILSNLWLQSSIYCSRPRPFNKMMLRRVRPPMPPMQQPLPLPKR